MGAAFGQLLPIAVAAALSTVPISITILVLLSPERKKVALPFLIGMVLGTAAVLTLAAVAAQLLPDSRARQPQTAIGVLEILIGAALVLLGARAILRRDQHGNGQLSKWVQAAGSFGAASSFGIGLALNLRPKGLLLSAAAGLTIHSAALGPEDTLLLIVAYTAIATSTVVAPILGTLVSPQRMEPRLLSARDWIAANGAVVTAVIMIVIGAVVLGAGIGNL